MKRKISIIACAFVAAIVVIVFICAFDASNNSEKPHNPEVITFYSTDALLAAMANEDKHPALDCLDQFYTPVLPAEYELSQIDLTKSVIEFIYSPRNQQNTDNTADVVRTRFYSENDGAEFTELKESLKYDIPTRDGYYYRHKENQITFSVGNSFLSISVPDSLNSYDNLKQLCSVKRYPESGHDLQCITQTPELTAIKPDILLDYFSGFKSGVTYRQTVIDVVGECHNRYDSGTKGEIYYTADHSTVEIFYTENGVIERIFIKPTR